MRVAISILLLVFLPLALQEFGELAPWMAERLLKRGTRWLPPAYREQYEQDWLGELDTIPGKITKLGFTFRVLVRVPATERALTGRDALWGPGRQADPGPARHRAPGRGPLPPPAGGAAPTPHRQRAGAGPCR
jgi:hypothetical protein